MPESEKDMSNPLLELTKLGQSVWYDNMRRGLITSGEFRRMVEEDGVTGVTSNPTIFEKAITASADYDAAIRELISQGKGVDDIYQTLVVEDIQSAADILRPVYDRTAGRDGFVSLEVSPELANETQPTIDSARALFRALDRPNVMIKIPGTPEGIPAIEQCLSEGINVNVTLLFGVENYEQVALAYIAGLEKLAASGRPVDRIASVASFFVSRVDTLADKQLEESASGGGATPQERERLESLRGKAGIANAKVAYRKFQEIFAGERFQALAKKGAGVQRCLWASTSTKNPDYRDVMYAEGLIGPDTVDTMPQATLDAFRDHGRPAATLAQGVDEARETLRELARVGIDLRQVTDQLQVDGVQLFADSYRKLIQGLGAKREAILAEASGPYSAALGEHRRHVEERLRSLEKQGFTRRLWAKDATLWKDGSAEQLAIKDRLGWLGATESMLEHCDALRAFGAEVKDAGFQRAVLLGMGGSSLAPEVFQRTFGPASGHPDLAVLDTTDPAAILVLERELDLARTLFIVSSKGGTTTETSSLCRYFFEKVQRVKGPRAGENFVAITDHGTPLERLAAANGFRRCFLNAADIGGRFSVLSYFGLVPAAVLGMDVERLLDRAEALAQASASCIAPADNPGVWLGAILGELAKAGRDKVTLVPSPALAAFGTWVEQLLAESTGKEGRGLIPVDREPLGERAAYGDDRLFVHLHLDGQADGLDEKLRALESAGHPVIRLRLTDAYDLGREFLRWEVATATAGAVLGVNPFDEPNVKESKDNTSRLLKAGVQPQAPVLQEDGLALFCNEETAATLVKSAADGSLAAYLAAHLQRARPGDYLALMAYLPPWPEHDNALQTIRLRLRDSLRLATTLGYGPRFLHSTGQLHKGGPDTALFIQLTVDDPEELPIPGEAYGFSTLKQAQALGDLASLQSRGRRVARVHLGPDAAAGLRRLKALVEVATAR
jgi:transaldolase/glucose-6-phosphate isomerase